MSNTFSIKNSNVIVCARAEDIPKVKHWAIIQTRTGIEKGYDKGDPDTSFNFVGYTAYLDKPEWEAAVIKQTQDNNAAYSKISFIALEVSPVTIKSSFTVHVDL